MLTHHVRASNATIDLLSIDVEGLDLQVLKSNDWLRFRPRVVVAEVLAAGLTEIGSAPTTAFLTSHRYQPYAKTGNSVIYVSE